MVCGSTFVLGKAMLILSIILVALRSVVGEDERTPLRVLGLFPYRGSAWDGEYVIPAARLALKEINNNTEILPDYKLELIEANSSCSQDPGLRAFVRYIHAEHSPVAVLGPGCSSSSIPIASVAGRDEIRTPQLSYGATSVFLSFKHSYPYFYRTVSTNILTTIAKVKLMEKFKWRRYGIHNAGVGDSNQIATEHAIATLRVEAEGHLPDSVEIYSGYSRDSLDEDYYKNQLMFTEDMLANRMRVGLLFGAQQTDVARFFCLLYRQKLTYPRVVWILSNQRGNWYNSATDDCSEEEIVQATHSTIHLEYQVNTNSIINVTNKTFMEYFNDYKNEVRNYAIEVGDYNASSNNISLLSSLFNDWSPVVYDSLWTLGLALDKAERSLNYRNLTLLNSSLGNDAVSSTILKELGDVDFNGASGRIKFDRDQQRQMEIKIEQVQHGRLVTIGSYLPSHNTTSLGELFLNESALLWSVDDPPLDDFNTETILAHKWACILMLVLLVIGFIWNSFSLLMNFRYQEFHSIKASSPPLNYMIFAGNYILLLAGIMVVIKSIRENDTVVFSMLCRTHSWLFDLGLLLLLNTALLKSWRIYRIFYSGTQKPTKLITDNFFLTLTVVLVVLNTLYRLVFVLVDDRNIVMEQQLPFENQVRERIVYCRYLKLWGLFYIPHFAIGVSLCLIAFSIRKIKHKYKRFNDAANIAIFFYATTPVAGICLTLSFVFSPANEMYRLATPALILDCVAICVIVYMCQVTLFVPKMLPLFRQWCRH